MSLARYAIGLCLAILGVHLGFRPQKLGRIGFGGPGGAVPKGIPPLPQWIGLFIAAELFCFGVTMLAWDTVVRRQFFMVVGVFLFLLTWTVTAIVAGLSARQQPGFTSKTASQVRGYRVAAFIYAAIGIAMLLLFFLPPLMRHR